MFNSFKNSWWIFLLLAAGAVFFLLSASSSKPPADQGVVLGNIFHQQPLSRAVVRTPAVKKDPVPPMAIVATPVDGHEEGFSIQVYSFQDKTRAQAALQSLKDGGFKAYLVMSDLGPKGIWWRVRVGGIADEAAATKCLEKIRKDYNSGFIIRFKN
ncbi:MAG: SPOR domain-containing protein [Candidatus Omnitrophica bacterium]|nr:SPOR domain-containing protein [Candidatus Omnitrophota bacterium]MDE2010406.1 SPOR domain-containing protein [Candidatus Omnitrophota bacterium]MDE2214761.1 SPOR domain-containing protein [Candidatus Omnitrophota bacterium]MDE2231456.1 SPOR domain-containing protein [Candidatus Omnitrophota bacterium]